MCGWMRRLWLRISRSTYFDTCPAPVPPVSQRLLARRTAAPARRPRPARTARDPPPRTSWLRSMNLMATCSPVVKSTACCTKPKVPLSRSRICRRRARASAGRAVRQRARTPGHDRPAPRRCSRWDSRACIRAGTCRCLPLCSLHGNGWNSLPPGDGVLPAQPRTFWYLGCPCSGFNSRLLFIIDAEMSWVGTGGSSPAT
jgi:hypothetical protein